jgi:hypothetical protein
MLDACSPPDRSEVIAALNWQDVPRPNMSEPDGLALLPPDLTAEIQTSGWAH